MKAQKINASIVTMQQMMRAVVLILPKVRIPLFLGSVRRDSVIKQIVQSPKNLSMRFCEILTPHFLQVGMSNHLI
jgi:hypothetical protein